MSAFKDCDIRGVYPEEVDEGLARGLGRAVAAVAVPGDVAVGGDVRLTTPALKEALVAGLVEGGRNVVDLGILPTPAYYFEMDRLSIPAGVIVTGSHNPANYNGFKPKLGPLPVTPEELTILEQVSSSVPAGRVHGKVIAEQDLSHYTRARIERFVGISPKRVVIDCGNGVLSRLAPELFRALGCQVVELFCEPDGRFPNRQPNTAEPAQLAQVSAAVVEHGVDIGVAFDGDGDRVAFIMPDGRPVQSDKMIALLAREALADAPGACVVHDLKCSRVVPDVVLEAGGRPLLERSGHTFIKTRMIVEQAVFGGEISGHYFHEELLGGDDALFTALLVVGLLERWGSLAERIAELPAYHTLPDLRVPYHGDRKSVLRRLAESLGGEAELVLVDGVRAEWGDRWGVARASVTEPMLTFRFEGRSVVALRAVAERFLSALNDPLRETLRRSLDAFL
jgi:phosphomannomutase/phosphoglucomutase